MMYQNALLAAHTGVQLGLNRVFAPSGVGTCGTWTFDLSAIELRSCSAEVTCRSLVVDSQPYYTLESEGSCSVSEFSASRRMEVRATP